MKTQISKASHGRAQFSEEYKQQALELYSQSPIGLGRLLQRSNLKNLYRTVERIQTAQLV